MQFLRTPRGAQLSHPRKVASYFLHQLEQYAVANGLAPMKCSARISMLQRSHHVIEQRCYFF